MSDGVDLTALKERLTAARAGRAVNKLLVTVRAGRHEAVPARLEELGPGDRKAALAELKALRAEVRGWGWARWNEQTRVRGALRVAGAGCHTGAAAAAAWIGGRDLSDWSRSTSDLVLRVLADRDPAWLGDVAQRLAERPAVAEGDYRLVHELVLRSGCAVPTTDGYILGWTGEMTGAGMLERLRADPQTPILVPRILDMVETPDRLTWTVGPEAPTHWPTALKTLADEGVLDRAGLVEGCVARLLRGGKPRDLRFPLALLQLLGTDREERRGRTAAWIGMAADAPSPVAAFAQEVLAGLAAAGDLSVRDLAEMSGPVLFRTEKKLVRAQLSLLGKELRRRSGAAAELLPLVSDAFGHEDTGIQERALKLVGRHLAEVDEQVREELAAAAASLSAVHRQAAEDLFGAAADFGDDLPYEEVLPPVPALRPVRDPAGTVAEVVEDLVAVSRGRTTAPEEFERALDGLVRHAHLHREELKGAVAAAFADAFWMRTDPDGGLRDAFGHHTYGMDVVLAALMERVRPSAIHSAVVHGHGFGSCVHQALDRVVDARLWEAASVIGSGRLPFLLATPTRHTGAIDPPVLVERLRTYRDARIEPAPADLAQALLRVHKAAPSAPDAAAAAAELGTRAGERLADWLTADPSLMPGMRFLARGSEVGQGMWRLADRVVLKIRERRTVREEFPRVFQWLGGAESEAGHRCHHWIGERVNWPAVLPDDRETLASLLLPVLAGGVEWDERGVTWGLTALAESGGPAGPATHLAVAVGLGCRHAEDRLTAVDALLVLAARRDLDAQRLGEQLAGLVADGTVKVNRLADAARTAAATGAYATTWAVLVDVLRGLLTAERPVRGLGELLAVAADCVERCGAREEVAGLDAVAERGGSSQFVVQARRLRTALNNPSGNTDRETTQVA